MPVSWMISLLPMACTSNTCIDTLEPMCKRCSADVETAAGLATAEAADPDAAVPIAEASPDAIMDAAGSDGPLEPAPRDAVVSDAAAPAVGPGPGLPSAAADDAAFEGVLKPETGAGAAGEAHAVAGSEALSLGEHRLLISPGCTVTPRLWQQSRVSISCNHVPSALIRRDTVYPPIIVSVLQLTFPV